MLKTSAILSIICFSVLLYIPCWSLAELPEAPVILDSGPGGCVPTQEICGDGIDQDCNGSDLLCSGNDKDRDGFEDSSDCNDTNRKVYPGVSVACSASCGQGTQTCQSNGSFTSCSCTPLCEAKSGGRCYYISSLTGSDSNPGTFTSPWKTFKNIISWYNANDRPSGWASLKAGDVVYFQSGVYPLTYNYNGTTEAFFLRNVHGTADAPIIIKSYPGAHPVLSPDTHSFGMHLMSSSHILVEGFEVVRAYGAGIRYSSASNIELRNVWIHDTDGLDNNNIAGLYLLDASNTRTHHSLIHDNYDKTCADTSGNKTENSRDVVLFGGGNNRLDHNVVFQTPAINAQRTGACICYKHSATIEASIFEVDHNILWNCSMHTIGSGSFGTRIHHNLILNSADAVSLRDFGGPTHLSDIVVENNTVIASSGMYYRPTETWGPLGELTYKENIVADSVASHTQDRAIIKIDPYGTDEMYNKSITSGILHFGPNCYHNTGAEPRWSIFASNGGSRGVEGGLWDLPTWQSKGHDAGSSVVDPQLDASQIPHASACQSMGWNAP